MPTDTRTTDEIERDIEQERAGLTDTLDTLQDRFSAESLVRAVGDQFRNHGGEIGQSISRSVKENPIALALTGVGLTWLILGEGARSDRYSSDNDHAPRPAMPRRTSPGVTVDPAWLHRSPGVGRPLSSGDESSSGRSAANMAGSVRDGFRETASSVGESIREGRDSASDRMAKLHDQLSEGTDKLSQEARERVIDARERAMAARDRASHHVQRGATGAQDLFEQYPLVAGALALAVGSAIGGALPRTDAEDAAMGASSDDLINDAERIFREELPKASAVAEAVSGEAKAIRLEKAQQSDDAAPGDQTVSDALKTEVKHAGSRLVDAARSEADAQGLGKTDR